MNNSIDTVNAAATAIVTAEARVQQPTTLRQKWGWSQYWCFGHRKNNKRIGHAPDPEQVVSTTAASVPAAETESENPLAMAVPAILLPFIAPPSSPASFLPSATLSPAKVYSPHGPTPTSMFALGPYAYDTQLVSPPVFSTFTTEPSTAPLTPPPESMHLTTPSSPEVPFAQLVASSLERTQRRDGLNQKFQPHHLYPGSPDGLVISPGSVVLNSGTSSPLPSKRPAFERQVGEAPKLLGYEHFSTWKWGSTISSGSQTPNEMGIGSKLMPDGLGPPILSHDGFAPPENQKAAIACVPNLCYDTKHDDTLIDHHRVSFELTSEDVARCLANKSTNSIGTSSRFPQDTFLGSFTDQTRMDKDPKDLHELSGENTAEGTTGKPPEDGEKEACYQMEECPRSPVLVRIRNRAIVGM